MLVLFACKLFYGLLIFVSLFRMEAAHAAHLAAKAEVVADKRRLYEAQQVVARKLQAAETSEQFLAGLHATVWGELERKGFLLDHATQQVEAFLPLLFQQVQERLGATKQAVRWPACLPVFLPTRAHQAPKTT